LLWLIVLSALLISLNQAWQYGKLTQGFDFFEKWQVGQKFAGADAATIYSPQLLDLHISSPFLYALYAVFTTGDYAFDVKIYRLLCLISMVAGIIGFSLMLGYPLWGGMLAVVVFTYRFQPFLSDVRVANVNQIQLGLLALFIYIQHTKLRFHNFLAGLILGFAVAAKPNLGFVAAMLLAAWLVNRRRKKTIEFSAGMATAAAVAVIAASIVFGSFDCWREWLKILPQASNYRYPVDAANYSAAMLLFVRYGFKASAFLSVVLFGMGIAAVAAVSHWVKKSPLSEPKQESFEDILMTGMGCLIYLMSAALVWLHYFILAIPMALFVLRPQKEASALPFYRPLRYALGAISVILIAQLPLSLFFGSYPFQDAVFIVIGTGILYALGISEILLSSDKFSEAMIAPKANIKS
jgi:hypothetical protein